MDGESNWGRCTRCNEHTYKPWDCRCQKFEVYKPYQKDGEPDWEQATEVYASDAEAAVEKFAEDYDSEGDYTIIGRGGCDLIWCRGEDPEGNEEITKWEVTAEATPQYYAYEKK